MRILLAFLFLTPSLTAGNACLPVVLRAGIRVELKLAENLDPQALLPGHSISLTTAGEVKVNEYPVITAEAPARGVVRQVRKTDHGRFYEITLAPESAQAVDGQTVYLNAIPFTFKVARKASKREPLIGRNLVTAVRNDIRIEV